MIRVLVLRGKWLTWTSTITRSGLIYMCQDKIWFFDDKYDLSMTKYGLSNFILCHWHIYFALSGNISNRLFLSLALSLSRSFHCALFHSFTATATRSLVTFVVLFFFSLQLQLDKIVRIHLKQAIGLQMRAYFRFLLEMWMRRWSKIMQHLSIVHHSHVNYIIKPGGEEKKKVECSFTC